MQSLVAVVEKGMDEAAEAAAPDDARESADVMADGEAEVLSDGTGANPLNSNACE